MTINSQVRTAGPFTGTGSATPYPFAFKVFQASDLLVARTDTSGTQIVLTLTTDYTVTLNADQNVSAGGTLSLISVLPAGYALALTSNISVMQPLSLTNTGGFYPRAIEDAFDRITILQQQQGLVGVGQGLRVPEIGGITALSPVSGRANNLLGFDSNGNPIAVAPIGGSAAALATTLASSQNPSLGAGQLGYNRSLSYPAGTLGAKAKDSVSLAEFTGAIGDGVTNCSAAVAAAEASGANDIWLPPGSYLVNDGYVFTKRWTGPGSFKCSATGAPVQTGGGLNDMTVSGTFTGNSARTFIVQILATGAPDQLQYSYDNGVTWVTTQSTYVQATDSYTTGPITITAGPMALSCGLFVTFAATTGHTLNSSWRFTSGLNPMGVNSRNIGYAVGGIMFAAAFGVQNTQLGVSAFGANLSYGVQNTAVGYRTLEQNTSGYANVAVGALALRTNTTGFFNVAVGLQSLEVNTTGYDNTAIGQFAQQYTTTGASNTALGSDVLGYNTSGNQNTGVGVQSLYTNVTGSQNTAVGLYSQRGGSTSLRPFYVDKLCNYNIGATHFDMQTPIDTGIVVGMTVAGPGIPAGSVILSMSGTGIDIASPATQSGGGVSLRFGYTDAALSPNYCTSVGSFSLFNQRQSLHNAAFGFESLYNATGQHLVAVGSESGFRITSGTDSTFLGYSAGANVLQMPNTVNAVCVGDNTYTTGSNAVAIGSGVVGTANHVVIGNAFHATVRTTGDNITSLGDGSRRWSTVYAGTGVINTSDERSKQQIRSIDDAVLRAWSKVDYCQYRFNDSVVDKGDGARWHIGVIAQAVKAAFESEGLDPFAYGILCYDQWPEETAEVAGETIVTRPAGDRYGIRYEEALSLECAYLRSQLKGSL